MTNLGFDWSIVLFCACGWMNEVCNDLVLSEDQKHKKLINYDPKLTNKQISIGKGECLICSE